LKLEFSVLQVIAAAAMGGVVLQLLSGWP
jgi:hypothetical protein